VNFRFDAHMPVLVKDWLMHGAGYNFIHAYHPENMPNVAAVFAKVRPTIKPISIPNCSVVTDAP